MPRIQTPCGEVELPEQTAELLDKNAQDWADQAGDAFVGGLAALANGKLAEANTCFEEAKRCLSRVQALNAQALELAERASWDAIEAWHARTRVGALIVELQGPFPVPGGGRFYYCKLPGAFSFKGSSRRKALTVAAAWCRAELAK